MKLARAIEARLLSVAPWALVVSVIWCFTALALRRDLNMVDLRVYQLAPRHLLSGDLYDFTYAEFTPDFPLPFTYPPFAALVLLPLAPLRWGLLKWAWLGLSVLCLWWIVRCALRLIAADRADAAGDARVWRRRACLAMALALWAEPVRSTMAYGQINLVLVATLVGTMASKRPWVAGLGVGITAGMKLTPAISGLYFLVTRRFEAAAWSVAFGVASVGLAWLVVPKESRRYWLELLGDAGRVGPAGTAINQSLRGALTRTVGYDVHTGPLWMIAVAVIGVLVFFALRSTLRAGDDFGTLLVVQLFGLLASPVSWSHHWVWVVPLLLWLLYGRVAGRPLAVAAVLVWLPAIGTTLIQTLINAQPTIWVIQRPWYLSLLGWAYPVCAVLSLVAIAGGTRRLPGAADGVDHTVDFLGEGEVGRGDPARGVR